MLELNRKSLQAQSSRDVPILGAVKRQERMFVPYAARALSRYVSIKVKRNDSVQQTRDQGAVADRLVHQGDTSEAVPVIIRCAAPHTLIPSHVVAGGLFDDGDEVRATVFQKLAKDEFGNVQCLIVEQDGNPNHVFFLLLFNLCMKSVFKVNPFVYLTHIVEERASPGLLLVQRIVGRPISSHDVNQ
ncbi:hypothetical protein CSOJ01_07391 [Colletotrichum sojae]|uniref:Uncharacterized protein n=1 Tax=Colletotrichum sojae TaxID=2175907 RepID=A0A8H6J8X3_9PEZI|nr:hypothetical protein CSOJ01_07391 [Colletotrichum sojae]